MHITDLASVETWKELERFISENYDMNGRVYDPEGKPFTGQAYWCNRLCPAVRQNPAALSAICSSAHQNMAIQARNSGKPVIGECDLGLCKIVVPIHASGEYIGAVGGCGRLPEDGAVEEFVAEKTAGLSKTELEELSADLKTMSQAEAEDMAAALSARVADLTRRLLNSADDFKKTG